jgi:fructose/tagatose bisphosphate aldolase
MNILEAAREYFGVPKELEIGAAGWEVTRAFFAGAAIGAMGARMSQEEILKAVRDATNPAEQKAVDALAAAAGLAFEVLSNKESELNRDYVQGRLRLALSQFPAPR